MHAEKFPKFLTILVTLSSYVKYEISRQDQLPKIANYIVKTLDSLFRNMYTIYTSRNVCYKLSTVYYSADHYSDGIKINQNRTYATSKIKV